MTKTEYAQYLQSAHWQAFRKSQIDGAEECQRCGIPRWLAEIAYDQDLHIHHLNYACLGKETGGDIEILCRRCHEVETFGRSELREPKRVQCETCGGFHYNPRFPICAICDNVFNAPWLWFASGTDLSQSRDEAIKNLLIAMDQRFK